MPSDHGAARRPLLAACAAMALTVGPAMAQETATVTAHGAARDRIENTVADVRLGVEAQAPAAPDVQKALTSGLTPLLAYLRDAKLARLRTSGLMIQPTPQPVPGQPPQSAGFTGRASISFEVEAGRLGAVLDGALGQGANMVDGLALRPRESEMDAARNRLAAEATRTALAQAKAVAEAAGLRLGPVKSIAIEPGQGVPRPMMARAASAGPMPTEAGDSEVSASVTITAALAPPLP